MTKMQEQPQVMGDSACGNDDGMKLPITNCHTHIFIGESVPPLIAKTMAPWPFYKIFTIPLILGICKFYYLDRKYSPYAWQFKPWYKKIKTAFQEWRIRIKRNKLLNAVALVANFLIVYHACLFMLRTLLSYKSIELNGFFGYSPVFDSENVRAYYLLLPAAFSWFLVVFVALFIATGRKLLFFIFKKAWNFLAMLPEKTTIDLIGRYINIGRFAYYKNQARIMLKLQAQYPTGTRFVVLPMDMQYMGAGDLSDAGNYTTQMSQLADIKASKPNIILPFVAVDPRRDKAGNQLFIDWFSPKPGKIELLDCFIKEYIEVKNFSGFKIYPALGYFPFDKRLLPLWKYAAEKGIPILTHCIRGTIFYRGEKDPAWDEHPVFRENVEKNNYRKMFLHDIKNKDFSVNFTHPLNYLCLLEERLLRILISDCTHSIKKLFGYTNAETPLEYDLRKLKICFGHYGGDDEWTKHFEKDRDDLTNQLQKKPLQGVNFLRPGDVNNSWGLLENAWKNLDWYTVISSMMLQFPNIYADISYILHNQQIVPLLKATLKNPGLKEKVLFGTDFYVVRNHKSEREMLANLQGALTQEEFDLIARTNPDFFLK